MVYGRLIFNNIKEYTPSWFQTIPYSQVTKPTFVRGKQVVGRFNADPKVKAVFRFLQENVQNYPWLWQTLIFFNAFVYWNLCMEPWLWIYRLNNKDRTLDAAIEREKNFKKTQVQE